MKSILGIGTAGCNVVEQLSQYKTYQAYYISNEVQKTTKYKFSLPYCSHPEEYEALNMTKLHKWIENIEKNWRPGVVLKDPNIHRYYPIKGEVDT